MKTTLNKIREHNPCEYSWKKLLKHLNKTEADDEPLEIKTILDSNGIQDAVWALRAVDGHDRDIRLFIYDCAESVLHLFEKEFANDYRPREAIDTSRRFANGECGLDELSVARDGAFYAAKDAFDATEFAGYTAAYANSNAAWHASIAAWNATEATSSGTLLASSSAVFSAAYAASDPVLGAWDSAWNAARNSEKEKQVALLMKYI